MSVATAQVATHSRFKCAQCGAKIEKNVAFVLVKADGSKVHVKCAGKVLDKTVTADQIKDLETIEQADQDALKALVSPSAKPAAPAAAANNAGRPKRAAASGKRKADAPASSESEEASQEKPKKKAAPAKAKAAPAPKAKRAKKDASESEDEEDASSVSDKPAKKAKAAPKAKFTRTLSLIDATLASTAARRPCSDRIANTAPPYGSAPRCAGEDRRCGGGAGGQEAG